jgi:hypothetical protein
MNPRPHLTFEDLPRYKGVLVRFRGRHTNRFVIGTLVDGCKAHAWVQPQGHKRTEKIDWCQARAWVKGEHLSKRHEQ